MVEEPGDTYIFLEDLFGFIRSVIQTKHRGEKSASAREKVSLIFSLDTKHIDMKPWEARNAKWETTAWLSELNIIIKFLQVPYGP